MAEEEFDFEFDESELDMNDKNMVDIDKEFLDSIQARTSDSCTQSSNEALNYWFLIILLLLFVFFLVMAVVFVVKGRRRRQQYEEVGYR